MIELTGWLQDVLDGTWELCKANSEFVLCGELKVLCSGILDAPVDCAQPSSHAENNSISNCPRKLSDSMILIPQL